MKKIIALFLAAMMMLGMAGTALAYDEQITFQEIPWGSSVEETIKLLNEKGFLDPEWAEYVNQVLIPESGYYIKKREEINAEMSGDNGKVLTLLQIDRGNLFLAEDKRIAGYPVERLEFTFVVNGAESQLVDVGIDLKYENAAEAIADLQQKLTSVYGNSKHADVFYGTIATDCWIGADNSIILLYSSENGSVFTLDYGTLNAERMIAAASGNAPKNNVDSSDVGGL